MPTWRAVKKSEDFFVLGHVIKKLYLCSGFEKRKPIKAYGVSRSLEACFEKESR